MDRRVERVKSRLEESAKVKMDLSRCCSETIWEIARVVAETLRRGSKVILFGNGGSAADAQHIAAELMGKYLKERKPLPAIALTVNTSSLTAIANDYSYSEVFLRQLEGIAMEGDLIWGISTSGNSPNVVEALKWAKMRGLRTVGFTGEGGGRMADHCHYLLAVPSRSTPRIQEAHIAAAHIICELVEEELFGGED